MGENETDLIFVDNLYIQVYDYIVVVYTDFQRLAVL